ncbi:MAG: hypothetical protein ABFQ53_02155 [Patescibacteria group bacterium]
MNKEEVIKNIYNKIHKHKILFLLLLIFMFIGIEFISYKFDRGNSFFVRLANRYYFEPSLEKTKNFYIAYDTPLETDEFVMLLGLWPELANDKELVFTSDPFYRTYKDSWQVDDMKIVRRAKTKEELKTFLRLFGIDAPVYDIGDKYNKTMTDFTDNVVVKALYCDKSGYDDFDYKLLNLIRDNNGGYGDTHFLMSILFLEKLDCLDKEVLNKDKKSVLENIIKTQKEDEVFSDLFAERVVVLYWAGEGSSVKFPWILKIAKNIKSDGGWRDVGSYESNPHVTGLSALAIKYFINDDFVNNIWFASE